MRTGANRRQLYEQYRPTSLGEVVGQAAAVRQVRHVAKRGLEGRAFWISGLSGTGKTTTSTGQQSLFDEQMDCGPLLSRCIAIGLKDSGLTAAFAKRVHKIARAEGLDSKPLASYRKLARQCSHNMRAMLQAVEAGTVPDAGK